CGSIVICLGDTHLYKSGSSCREFEKFRLSPEASTTTAPPVHISKAALFADLTKLPKSSAPRDARPFRQMPALATASLVTVLGAPLGEYRETFCMRDSRDDFARRYDCCHRPAQQSLLLRSNRQPR